LRRTAVIGTCIAAVALTAPAFATPGTSTQSQDPPARALPAEGLRMLHEVSLAQRPVARPRPAPAAQLPAPRPPAGVPPAQATRPYTVRAGDNLWSIATAHGIPVEALVAANDLALSAILQPGQTLAVPGTGARAAPAPRSAPRPAPSARRPASREATVHVVRPGETLWGISQRYGARLEDVMADNELGDAGWIRPGQRVRIAGPAVPRHRQVAVQARSGPESAVDMRALQASGAFLWPARGVITSRFGWRYRRHHNGIDIAAPRGTPIYAARDGVVEFAGWKGGYGRVVYLNHGGGIVTVYGHASTLVVREGERVTKGQLIARVGCTGVCTGAHLHFEVQVNGRAVNPLGYLY
jgi:murein DD-endopeptidase MepM/ murein hydrolase activator NlpD